MLENKINVYPNPCNGSFTISLKDFNSEYYKMTILDLNGKIVWSDDKINTQEVNINLGSVNKGIYFIKVHLGEELFYNKIIII